MARDGIGAAVRIELADPWAEIDQHTKGEKARNHVDNTGAAEVVIALIRDQPARSGPAPGSPDNPGERAEHDGENDEAHDLDALNHST